MVIFSSSIFFRIAQLPTFNIKRFNIESVKIDLAFLRRINIELGKLWVNLEWYPHGYHIGKER